MHPTRRSRVITLAVGFGLLAMSAQAQLIGPTYYVLDDYTLTVNPGWHAIGRAGGADGIYAGFDMDNYIRLYWGPAPIWEGVVHAVQVALDGAIDAVGESLQFDPGASNLAGGIARWTGESRVFVAAGPDFVPRAVDVRFTADSFGAALVAASSVPDIAVTGGVGAVLPVTGDFTVNWLFEAKFANGRTWMPLMDFYDGLETDPGREVRITFDSGFWYQELRPGDCNEDGAVNLVDWPSFMGCMAGPVNPYPFPVCACVDFDEDGDVDLRDYGKFLEAFTG